MARSKISMISGPMDARHVGGINVKNNAGSGIDHYFNAATLEPDEFPSHTFVARGRSEAPRRSDTIANTIRRPSLSVKRSMSNLRRKSISHYQEANHNRPFARSENAKQATPIRMQSSLSRLRQRVGLDRDVREGMHLPKVPTPEPETVPEPIQKDYPPLAVRKSLARLTTASSIYTTASDSEHPAVDDDLHRHPSGIGRQLSLTSGQQSRDQYQNLTARITTQVPAAPPVRPKRADSGTAIDFDHVPVQERPLPFKEILAVSSFSERMAMYKKTRDYWANADHGLVEWTGRAVAPRSTAHHI